MKKILFHVSVTSFLCCLYFFPLIFSRRSCCVFPHCLCTCRSVALCVSKVLEWHLHGVKLVPLWFWEPGWCWVAPKSSSHMMTKPQFSRLLQILSFSLGFNFIFLFIFLILPDVSFFFLSFLEICCISPSPHTWEDTCHNLLIFI